MAIENRFSAVRNYNNLSEAQKICRKLARTHYENFTVGSLFLPRHIRQHIYNIYAYSRIADDLADEGTSSNNNMNNLNDWEQKLIACYRGEYLNPVFVALADTIRTFDIPIQPFQNLLNAFRQDQTVNRYETFDDLLGYCKNSANPVGRIYLYLFGLADQERFGYSDKICTALQLTNFWQDVSVDWKKGRVYIPQEDLKHFDCSEAELNGKTSSQSFRELIRFEVDRTQRLFDEGKSLLALVPSQPKFEIRLFIRGGESILELICQQNYDVLGNRPALNKWDKMKLFARTWWQTRNTNESVPNENRE